MMMTIAEESSTLRTSSQKGMSDLTALIAIIVTRAMLEKNQSSVTSALKRMQLLKMLPPLFARIAEPISH